MPNSTALFIYSTFFDLRNGNKGYKNVRMIGIARKVEPLFCQFRLENGERKRTEVSWYMAAENHNRPFKVYILNCEVPLPSEKFRTFQLTMDQPQSSLDLTPEKTIEDPMPGVPTYNYSICMPVLFGAKYKPHHLIEFFETVKLLGAQHIFLYINFESHSMDMLQTLLYYSKNQSFVTIFPMEIPFKEDLIFYHGQLVAISDCLYHNMGLSKYVFFHDFDERVVPYSLATNYDEMFGSTWNENPKLAGFGFGAYYFDDLTVPFSSEPVELIGLKSTKHMDLIERRFTKCVVKPERIFEQGVHHVSRVVQDYYQGIFHKLRT